MATVSITIPDTIVPRLTAAMRSQFPQYAALTDAACFKKATADYWTSVLVAYEAQQAQTTAQSQVQAQIAQSTSDASGIG